MTLITCTRCNGTGRTMTKTSDVGCRYTVPAYKVPTEHGSAPSPRLEWPDNCQICVTCHGLGLVAPFPGNPAAKVQILPS